jgi:hypothetical protein
VWQETKLPLPTRCRWREKPAGLQMHGPKQWRMIEELRLESSWQKVYVAVRLLSVDLQQIEVERKLKVLVKEKLDRHLGTFGKFKQSKRGKIFQ